MFLLISKKRWETLLSRVEDTNHLVSILSDQVKQLHTPDNAVVTNDDESMYKEERVHALEMMK